MPNGEKISKLSQGLREKIVVGERAYQPDPNTPVSNFLVATKKHCSGGRTVDAGLLLRDHCDAGGKIFLTMAGAGSSFQMGITIGEMIRADKIAAISVTGANLEESLYRLVAHSHYAYIPNYQKLTRDEEKELDRCGFRRITDTFLPEEESVRVILPELMKLWRKAQNEGKSYLWHEFFFQLFENHLVDFDPQANIRDCWLYQCWMRNIPVIVGGFEDSTMGNIFAHATYDGDHPFLAKYKLDDPSPLNPNVVKSPVCYMHSLAQWYMDSTKELGHAFLQLGGGIAADFPICVVPHIKKDFLDGQSIEDQERLVPTWAAFVEIVDAHTSYGSYSGAGGDEKITWSKLEPDATTIQIIGDYTEHFPDIAAIVLRK